MIWKNVELHNVVELIEPEEGDGLALTRIPDELRTTLNDGARMCALHAAGCEVRLNLGDSGAKLTLSSEARSTAPVEVYQGSFQVSTHSVDTSPTEIAISKPQNLETLKKVTEKEGLPFDAGLTRIVLPYIPAIRLYDFEGDASPTRPGQTPPRTQLSYGSSITHGATATRSTGAYAMRTAQLLGMDLINLGFGGGAHCEHQLADYISGRQDWDLATLEMGINMVRNDSFTVEVFRERVGYFVEKMARDHQDKWIFCVDLFTFADDLLGIKGKQEGFREVVRSTVEDLDLPMLKYIDGRNLLKGVSGLTLDLVHPSPSGMEEIAQNLSTEIRNAMGA